MSDAARATVEAIFAAMEYEMDVDKAIRLLDAFAAEQTARAEAAEAQVEWLRALLDETDGLDISRKLKTAMKALLAAPVPPSGEPR